MILVQTPETLLAYMSHGYVSAPVEIEATSPDGRATLEVAEALDRFSQSQTKPQTDLKEVG